MFNDLDYFRTKDDIIYITRGCYHPKKYVYACPVYWPVEHGDRYNRVFKNNYYKKVTDTNNFAMLALKKYASNSLINEYIPLIPKNEIIEMYLPRTKTKKLLMEKQSIWTEILKGIIRIGAIDIEDIGIFGSYLVGLDKSEKGKQIKDIDYVIYGANNCQKLKNKFNLLLRSLGLSNISDDHIDYEVNKLGKDFCETSNTFKLTLNRKWSSIQVASGVLSTIRFVYLKNELPTNPINSLHNKNIVIRGRVIDDFGGNFVPRTFTIVVGRRLYRVVTYFWVYQSPVKIGEIVEIKGSLLSDLTTIVINQTDQGIKILNCEVKDEILSCQQGNMHTFNALRRGYKKVISGK